MKTIKYLFKEILYPASFLFTIYVFAMYLIAYAGKNNLSGTVLSPALLGIGYLYFIAVSFANKIFRTSLKMPVKVAVHFFALTIPLVLLLAIAGKGTMSPSTITVLILVFSLIYFVCAIPVLIIRGMRKKNSNEKQKYENQFDKVR